MRNTFEQWAGDSFELDPLHAPGKVFFSEPAAPADASASQGPASTSTPEQAQAQEASQQQDGSVSESSTDNEGGDSSSNDSGDDDDDFESQWAKGGWLNDNPIGTPTEREHYVLQQNLPVFRVLLRKV